MDKRLAIYCSILMIIIIAICLGICIAIADKREIRAIKIEQEIISNRI